MFEDDHELSLERALIVTPGDDVALIASGMMLSTALAAAAVLADAGVSASVVNVPVIKPLDRGTIIAAASSARAVVTAENHSVIGGLGTAVAEVLAEAGLGRPLRRVGLKDTFAEGARTPRRCFASTGWVRRTSSIRRGACSSAPAPRHGQRRSTPRRARTPRYERRTPSARRTPARAAALAPSRSAWAGSGPAGWARSWPAACSTRAMS